MSWVPILGVGIEGGGWRFVGTFFLFFFAEWVFWEGIF